jgi:hypothetical protein
MSTCTRVTLPVLNWLSFALQTTSQRILNAKSNKYNNNVLKRGQVVEAKVYRRDADRSCIVPLAFRFQRKNVSSGEEKQPHACRSYYARILPVCGCWLW